MKKILIIGAGDFQLPLVQEAAKQYEVYVAAPKVDKAFEPYIKQAFITDVRAENEILDFAKNVGIVGVVTDQTDIAVRTVAYVAEKLGLPGIGYDSACLFTDKALMRKRMTELGIPTLPNKEVFSLKEAKEYYTEIGGSVIIKPVDSQGSRGVQVCYNIQDLESKYAESENWSSNKGVVIERLASGREFFVEGASVDNKYETLICGDTLYFDIPDAFAAKSRIVPSLADQKLYERVCELDRKLITGFGLKQGPNHSEYIMDGDEIYLIETAARGGGVFISSDLISLSTGLNTEEFLLNIAIGKQKELPYFQKQKCVCGYIALFIPKGKVISVSGIDEVKSLPYVHRHQLDKLVVGLENKSGNTDKTSRIALIVSADNRTEFDERVKYIQSILTAEIQTSDGIKGIIWE